MTNLEKWKLYTGDLESPDLFLEWAFYSTISSALQRRVWFLSDPISKLPNHNSIFMNQFIILIGPPAAGKGRAIKTMKAVCTHDRNKRVVIDAKTQKVVMVTQAIFCTPDNITFEALFKFLAQQELVDGLLIDVVNPDSSVKKVTYCHSSATACIEELGVLFTKDTTDVASVLCQLYDAGNLARVTKTQGTDIISNVCVNFLAGTTTDAVKRLMASKVIEEGFATRVIFVFAPKPRFYRFSSDVRVEQQQAFNEIVEHVHHLATEVKGEVKLSPEAHEFMREYYESGKMSETERVNHDTKLDGYYGRKRLHWRKLAAIMHFAETRLGMEVGLDSVKQSLDLLRRTEIDMHLAFRDAGSNSQKEIADMVLSALKNNPLGLSYKKLLLTHFKDGTKQDLDEVMEFLVTTQQVTNVSGVYKLI